VSKIIVFNRTVAIFIMSFIFFLGGLFSFYKIGKSRLMQVQVTKVGG
jgi:multidrug efflux pump subunit AcrB